MILPIQRARQRRFSDWIALVGTAILVAGCAVPPLDDARLEGIRLATAEDMERHERAQAVRSREGFGGASVQDPVKGRIDFSAAEYDEYLRYEREHPTPDFNPPCRRPRYPNLRISFSTRRLLLEPDPRNPYMGAYSRLYFCDAEPIYGFGATEVMWKGRFLTRQRASDLKSALAASPQPQAFEIFVPYAHSKDWREIEPGNFAVTLMPPRGELCLSRIEFGYPTVVGKPLRIGKEAAANALGRLPRTLTWQDTCGDTGG